MIDLLWRHVFYGVSFLVETCENLLEDFLLSCRSRQENGGEKMDKDILMAMLEDIKQEVSSVQSEVNSVYSYVSDITETNEKLDKIIELLEQIANK